MGKPWFRVKQYGLGAGLPCSWEGWATLAVFFAVVVGSSVLEARGRPLVHIAVVLVAAVILIAVARLKSDKPWKWRWGQE